MPLYPSALPRQHVSALARGGANGNSVMKHAHELLPLLPLELLAAVRTITEIIIIEAARPARQ
eukprot:14876076-Alexandrium_andersonii.AAC.1